MSADFKGKQSLTITVREPVYNPETGARDFETTWTGSRDAVNGHALNLEAEGIGYRITNDGPIYSITAKVPENDPTEIEQQDRYEISTESQDKSIFEHPVVLADMETYDASIAEGAETYRERADRFVNEKHVYLIQPVFDTVVRHLKAAVTGFQIDFIVLRRFRSVDQKFAVAAGQFNLGDESKLYSTAQLNLPSNVAFSLPAAPTNPSADYSWRWKRRGQRVEIIGNRAEQTVELVFAPWSTLFYSNAAGDLAW